MTVPSFLRGGVDHIDRPLIRVAVDGADDEILAVVDTGFNGFLWLTREHARLLRISVPSGPSLRVSGLEGPVDAYLVTISILWLGTVNIIKAHVSARESLSRGGEQSLALVGTRMLGTNRLYIHFPKRIVVIR